MRIGLFGGTFDPPHLGHLQIARAAQTQLQLDEVVWIPAHRNPLKQGGMISEPKTRFQMVKAAVAGEAHMSVSDIELTRGGLSYTIDTVMELQYMQEAEYWLIVGSDSLSGISNWKTPEKLAKLCRIACVLRPPHDREQAFRHVPDYIPGITDFVDMPASKISSTMVRDHALRGLDLSELVHADVAAIIDQQRLYGR